MYCTAQNCLNHLLTLSKDMKPQTDITGTGLFHSLYRLYRYKCIDTIQCANTYK